MDFKKIKSLKTQEKLILFLDIQKNCIFAAWEFNFTKPNFLMRMNKSIDNKDFLGCFGVSHSSQQLFNAPPQEMAWRKE